MKDSGRTGIILAGMIGGALLGGVFAWLSSARTDEEDGETALETIGPAEYFQLGIGVLTLARQFQSLLQRKL